jgi:AcrR family transcriptional regulator
MDLSARREGEGEQKRGDEEREPHSRSVLDAADPRQTEDRSTPRLDEIVNVIYFVSVVHVQPTPRTVRREKTLERILDAAETILGAEGMAALTMQRLASELGYTVGATYRYFDSKEAIVAALQRRVFVGLSGDLALLDATITDPLVRVAVVARIYTTLASRRPLHARLLSRMMGEPENVLDAAHANPNMRLALDIGAAGVRELSAARAAGLLDAGNDLERGLVLWASLSGIAQTRKLERWQVPGLSADALADQLVTTLLTGWGADPKKTKEAMARSKKLLPSVAITTEEKKR